MTDEPIPANAEGIPTHSHKLGNQQFALYLKSQPRVTTVIYNIQKYLSSYDPFYYNTILFFLKGRDLEIVESQLNKQYERLTHGKSFLHKINKAIFSRERALEKVKRDMGKVERILSIFKKEYFKRGNESDDIYLEYTKEQGYTTVEIDETIESSVKMINNLFLDLYRLREMTIYIIETIHRWRVTIEEWMDQCSNHSRVDFHIRPSDYKMAGTFDMPKEGSSEESRIFYEFCQTDINFLWQSKLSEYIWFQFKQDPLIIRNSIYLAEKSDQQKTVLQKYFIEILYPNSDDLLEKTIRTLEMLAFEYQPKGINLYAEEEKLIENYLSLERQKNYDLGLENNQDDQMEIDEIEKGKRSNAKDRSSRIRISRLKGTQSASKITYGKDLKNEIQSDNFKWNQSSVSPYTVKQSNPRGWVFGKQLKRPSTEKIKQLVKKHEVEMNYLKNHKGIIKPFNISNYGEKNSIALAYISQSSPSGEKNDIENRGVKTSRVEESRGSKIKLNNFVENQEDKGKIQVVGKSFGDLASSRSTRMHQSLIKLNDIIAEDPKEDQIETPKNNASNKASNSQILFNKASKTSKSFKSSALFKRKTEQNEQSRVKTGRGTVEHQIKINSIFQGDQEHEEIKIEEEETPLNMKQFFQVFRADTNKPIKTISESRLTSHLTKSNLNQNHSPKGKEESAGEVHKMIDAKRLESLKHFKSLARSSRSNKKPLGDYKGPYAASHSLKKSVLKKNKNKLEKSKSLEKSQNSFKSYNKVEIKDNSKLNSSRNQESKPDILAGREMPSIEDIRSMDVKQFIQLKNRQITKDMIEVYIRHLIAQLPVSTESFTNYHTAAFKKHIIEALEDATIHSIFFDLEGEKDGKLGQAIVVQSLSSKLKLRYSIEFVNIAKFQLLVSGISRISEELLSTTPCQEVVLKLREDKMDPVSTHFINIIDQVLKKKAEKFCLFHILEKKVPGLSGQDLYERIYIFESQGKNAIREEFLKKRIVGSHRSINFTAKGLALASNFKLRSQNLVKAMIDKYKDESIGSLFVILLEKIMTKFHLKQLKIASLSLNEGDEMVGLVKNSPFLRNLFQNLLLFIRNSKKGDIPEWMKSSVTKFNNMTDLLNYLSYKEFDLTFKFDFLVESRFILNHELTLSQVDFSTSLEFIVQSSAGMLLLNNHRNFTIEEVSRNHHEKSPNQSPTNLNRSRFAVSSYTSGYLLPTTEDGIKLFMMSGKEYMECTDSLDLYSYLEFVFKESTIRVRNDISQFVVPDFTKRKPRINNVKMYDGLLRLFPERQFYSATFFQATNIWENLYPNAIISLPHEDAIVLDYPLILGFYDSVLSYPINAFLLKEEKKL